MVYARPNRRGTDEPLTFGVSGRLWRDTLVMFDRQTRSLWSQLKGRAVWGEMEGVPLEEVPSTRTTWGEWKILHPQTLALRKPAELQASPYAGYFASPNRLGVSKRELKDDRLPGKALVYGLESGQRSIAVPLVAGVTDTVIVRLQGRRILIARNGENAWAWNAPSSGAKWDASGNLRSRAGRRWNGRTGKCLDGAEPLEPAGGFKTYWFAWVSFHPDTAVYGGDRVPSRPRSRP